MDRTLAFLSGILFLPAAGAIWVFAPLWLSMVYVPSVLWLGWLLITAALRGPGSLPRASVSVKVGETPTADAHPQDSRKLAA